MAECEIIVLDKQIEKAPSHNGIVETGANFIPLMNRQYLYSILLFELFLMKKKNGCKA